MNLPADSATVRALDPAPGWGNVEELLASLVELVHEGNRLFVYANTPKNKRVKIPALTVPRPANVAGDTEGVKKKRPATAEEMARFFGGAVRYEPGIVPLERPPAGETRSPEVE